MRKVEICRFGGGGGGGGSSVPGHNEGGDQLPTTPGTVPNAAPPGAPNLTAQQAIAQAQALYGMPGPQQMGPLPQSMFPSQPLAALYHAVMAAQQPRQYQVPALSPSMQVYNRNVQ